MKKISYSKAIIVSLSVSVSNFSCVQDHSNHVRNIQGEDSMLALLLGQGFNHVDWTAKGHCVDLGAITTQSKDNKGQSVEYRLLEISNETQLREELNVSASASFKATLLGSGSGKINFAKSISGPDRR